MNHIRADESLIGVLYVDDEPDLLSLSKLYLEKMGPFQVEATTSASEALALIESHDYDAIVADYEMPGMHGIDLLKAVRKDHPRIPFILFTGRGREDVVIEALNNGADFYLQKGGDPTPAFTELAHKIQSAVHRRRAEDALRANVEQLGMAQAIGQIGSWEFDLATRQIRASEEAFRIFGLNLPAGSVDLDVIESCYVERETVCNTLARFVRTGEKYDLEYAIQPADGSDRKIIHSIAKQIQNAEGKTVKLFGVIQDVTGRKRTEEAFRESEEKHRLLLDESSDPIFSFYPDGTYRYVNRAFAEGVGKTVAEITGRKIHDVFSKEEADHRFAAVRRVFSTGVQEEIEVRVPRHDGDRYYITTVTPLKNDDGVVISALCSSKEITDRKRVEQELRESEEKFRSLVENANDIVYSLTLDGAFSYVSPNWTEVLGHDPASVIGTPVNSFIHPDDLPRCRDFLAATLTTGKKVAGIEYRVRHHDGTWRWHLSNASLIRNPDGSPVLLMGIARDITDKKLAEDVLANRLIFQQALIDSIPYPVFIKDSTARFAGCNRAYERVFGITRDYMLGKTVLDLEYLPVDERRRFHEEDIRVIEEAGHQSYELPIVYADGCTHRTLYSVDGFRLADGMPGGLIGMLVDISDRKQMEDTLTRVNRQLNLMTSITRHDINNNLTVIHGCLDLAGLQFSDPVLMEYLKKIRTATAAIESQIEFTKLYQNLGVQKPHWQDLDTILPGSHLPAQISLVADVKNVEVFADTMLERVFFNLLDNSVRHGETVTRITVSSSPSTGGLTIVWEDNGIGIAQNDKEKIFERGFGKNTGLGLFLVREILLLTGITIRETGTTGKSARFEIFMPGGMYRQKGGEALPAGFMPSGPGNE